MRFNWQAFCEARGIRFETSGPRVSKGNINIRCPWCGSADKSGHMGLSLDLRNPVYGCLRNSQHRGKNPARLVAQLLGIRFAAAEVLVSMDGPVLDDFERSVAALQAEDEPPKPVPPVQLDLPPELRPLPHGHYAPRFWDYLCSRRGFGDDVDELVNDYELYYALAGEQAWRLVFPVRAADGTLQGWTGRGIRGGEQVRYLTSTGLPTDALLWMDQLWLHNLPAAMCVVCEGPLDALKLDFYGREFGITAVATMGTGRAAAAQAQAIRERYDRCAIVLDTDAAGQALGFSEELDAPAHFLPPDVKDPGELSPQQAKIFLGNIAKSSLL